MIFKTFILRINAGFKYGMGHLSRTLSLARLLVLEKDIFFIIKTDDENMIKQFVQENNLHEIYSFNYINSETDTSIELEYLVSEINQKQAFLILDHYEAQESYQLYLKQKGIHWFQFDSHALWKFYGDIVMHASPGATPQLYEPLRGNKNTIFLLGPKYAVVNDKFKLLHNTIKPRIHLKRILISFGAGNDSGAIIKCLSLLEKNNLLPLYKFDIAVGNKNHYINEIKSFAKRESTISVRIDEKEMGQLMSDCDLGIIAPGTLSYEAASVGLPMILLAIASNQNINLIGWQNIGAAISLGYLNDFTPEDLSESVNYLHSNLKILESMSKNGLDNVDGKGCERITESILSI